MVSKWTGDRLTNGSIYEEHIRLNNYPYLSSNEELTHTSIAADVMQPKWVLPFYFLISLPNIPSLSLYMCVYLLSRP